VEECCRKTREYAKRNTGRTESEEMRIFRILFLEISPQFRTQKKINTETLEQNMIENNYKEITEEVMKTK